MSFTRWSPLLGTLVRLDDSGTDPPWPLEVYNPATHAWEPVVSPIGGVLYEYRQGGAQFVLTSEGSVIGVDE